MSITSLLGIAILLGGCGGYKEGPVIRLIGHDTLVWLKGKAFVDPGVIAFDQQDFDLTAAVKTIGNVDSQHVGYYDLTYTVTDKAGNVGTESRVVQVVHSNAALEGTYKSVANCPTCPFTGTATVSKYTTTADKIQIAPSMGNPAGNASSIVLKIAASGQLQIVNGTVPCNYTVVSVTGAVSDSGDSISFDLKLKNGSNQITYCSASYVKQ